MHICIVTETYWPEVNGVAMTLRRWAEGLLARGHTIQLIAPSHPHRPTSLAPGMENRSVASVPMPGYAGVRIGLPAGRVISRLWKQRTPDVVYVATEGPLGSCAVSVANRLGIRVVSGYHTNFHSYAKHYWFSFISPWVERRLTRIHNETQCTIVPTEWQREMLIEMGIAQVEIVGRGVDTALFSPCARSEALRRQWGVGPTDPVMILVGRIAEEKNLDLTLSAFEQMRARSPGLRFVMVGDGPARSRLGERYPDIIMSGVQTGESLAAHYASADLFVFSSKTETFGNVVLEAMASGLGLVAFDYAAASQHVEDGVNGLLAPLGDNKCFVEKTMQLLTDTTLLQSLRKSASRYAASQSWDAVVDTLESTLAGPSGGDLDDELERFRIQASRPSAAA